MNASKQPHPISAPLRWFSLILLIWPLLACGLPSLSTIDSIRTMGDPTPVPSPTPPGDNIRFLAQNYRVALPENSSVPGTNLKYIGPQDNGYEVMIDDRPAFKRAGDSFSWRGIIAPAVFGEYDLRLTTTLLGDLEASGPVTVIVLDPLAVELPRTNPPAAPLEYTGIFIDYVIPVGHTLPGTTLIYKGNSAQGAELLGTTNYPFVKQQDSLIWTGQLRDNVVLRYDLKVNLITDEAMFVTGTAELWVYN